MPLPTKVGRLHLDVVEPEPDPMRYARAPILCLHGLFAGSWVYDRVLPRIAEHGHPAAALSFRGRPESGGTAGVGKLGIREFAEDAVAAAQALDRPILLGHSLGGLIALLLLARGYARAAILVSPAPPRGIRATSWAVTRRMARHLPELLLGLPLIPTRDELDELVFSHVLDGDRDALAARMVPDSGRAARQAALGVYDAHHRSVRSPLLVVGADGDRFIPPATAQKVAARYGAPFRLAKGHGHFLFAEPGWEAELDAMMRWVRGLPRVVRDL